MTSRQSERVRPRRTSVEASERGELNDELEELHALLDRDNERSSFFERIGRQPGAALVLIVNFVPAVLALWLDWDPFAIVLIYWFENGIIGLVNLLKIALARPQLRTQADMLIGFHQAGIFALPPISRGLLAKLQRRPAERIPSAKPFCLAAFLLTFPVFMALHAAVLFRLLEGVGPSGLWPALRSSLSAWLGMALAALAIEHLWSFGYEFLYRDSRRHTIPILQVAQPFPKLIVIHVALLAGALIAQLLPPVAITAVALVLLKTALDMGLVLRIRITPSALRKMLEERGDAEDSSRAPQSRKAARHTGGPLQVSLPRVGLLATSRRFSGALAGAVLFTLFGGVIFGAFGLTPIAMAVSGRLDAFSSLWSFLVPIVGVPVGGLLVILGVSTLHAAIRTGWTRSEIRVADGEFVLVERGLVVWRRVACSCEDVESVDVVKSGLEVNNVPFWVLEVRQGSEHSAHRFLYGRPEAQLREIAEELGAALGLEPAGDAERNAAEPAAPDRGETAPRPAASARRGRPQ